MIEFVCIVCCLFLVCLDEVSVDSECCSGSAHIADVVKVKQSIDIEERDEMR